MKTRNLLMTISAAALVAITLTLNASEVLLSPRAKDTQSRIVPAVAAERNLVTEYRSAAMLRALDNQIKTVKGAESVNLTASKCNLIGSPKSAVSPFLAATWRIRSARTRSPAARKINRCRIVPVATEAVNCGRRTQIRRP